MTKKYVGSLAVFFVFLGGMLYGEGPSAAELRKMIDEHVVAEKAKIEEHFASKRSKMLRDTTLFGSITALLSLSITESVTKLVHGEVSISDSVRTVVGGVPACICGLFGVTQFFRLHALSAEKQAMLDQLETQSREFRRELNKQIRQEREEAARVASEKAKQPTNTPVDSDAEEAGDTPSDTTSADALVTEITAAADSDTKS